MMDQINLLLLVQFEGVQIHIYTASFMYEIYKRFEQAVHKDLWRQYHAKHTKQARPHKPNTHNIPKPDHIQKKDKITQELQKNLQLSHKYQFNMNLLTTPIDLPVQPKKEYKFLTQNLDISKKNFIPTNYRQKPLLPPNINEPVAAHNKVDIPNEQPQLEVERIFCPAGCGRYFQPSRLEKHSKICAKVFMAKRAQFDSSKHRIIDEMKEVKEVKVNTAPAQKLTWQEKSLALRAQLKQGKNQQLTQQQKQALRVMIEVDTSECPICKRRFNKSTIDKHQKFCQSKAKMRK